MVIYGVGAINPIHNSLRQSVFLETVFISMGKLAKADGRISQDEIDHVEDFMQRLNMNAEHRQLAIALFKRGADPDFDIFPTYTKFNAICGHTKHLKHMLMVYLIVMALADGQFHPAEQALLSDISGFLGYDRTTFWHLVDMVMNQMHFSVRGVSDSSGLDKAYKALGLSGDSSDQEIKRAYRKLMSQHHPDKLIGQGLPEDMIAVATEQAKEIQIAYDMIRKSRNM